MLLREEVRVDARLFMEWPTAVTSAHLGARLSSKIMNWRQSEGETAGSQTREPYPGRAPERAPPRSIGVPPQKPAGGGPSGPPAC
jgi:hypothetical protein